MTLTPNTHVRFCAIPSHTRSPSQWGVHFIQIFSPSVFPLFRFLSCLHFLSKSANLMSPQSLSTKLILTQNVCLGFFPCKSKQTYISHRTFRHPLWLLERQLMFIYGIWFGSHKRRNIMGKCGSLWRLNPIEWKRKSFLGTKYCIKREASPSTSKGRLGKWKMVLETYQQKSGQIWIIKSRAMIFQSFFINFLYAGPLWCQLWTVQLSHGNFTKFHFSWKCIFPLLFYSGMLGLKWLCMHLRLNMINCATDI